MNCQITCSVERGLRVFHGKITAGWKGTAPFGKHLSTLHSPTCWGRGCPASLPPARRDKVMRRRRRNKGAVLRTSSSSTRHKCIHKSTVSALGSVELNEGSRLFYREPGSNITLLYAVIIYISKPLSELLSGLLSQVSAVVWVCQLKHLSWLMVIIF